MKINQIEPSFDEKELGAVIEYLTSGGWMTEFKKTTELEKMIADYTGTKHCVMVANGTVSLFCALKAYDIGAGDEVICPDYTMIASPNAIKLAGAKPVLVDIDRESLCCDMKSILDKTTKKTKAIMLVSINGRYPDYVDAIMEHAYSENLIVIEDAAQSLGCTFGGTHVGNIGHVGSFSFSMPKIISMGQGGCLITDDIEIDKKLRMIKDFGRTKSGIDQHEIMGWNFKYTDLQAVIGIEQMKKLPERVKKKKQIYQWYKDNLEEVEGIDLIETSREVAPWFMDILCEDRYDIIENLKTEDIATRPFYPAIHTQPPYAEFKDEKFPNASYVAEHGLWLPSSVTLTEDMVETICDAIKEA